MFKILKIIPELINLIHTNKTTSLQVPLLYILRDRVFIMLCSDRSHRLAKIKSKCVVKITLYTLGHNYFGKFTCFSSIPPSIVNRFS